MLPSDAKQISRLSSTDHADLPQTDASGVHFVQATNANDLRKHHERHQPILTLLHKTESRMVRCGCGKRATNLRTRQGVSGAVCPECLFGRNGPGRGRVLRPWAGSRYRRGNGV